MSTDADSLRAAIIAQLYSNNPDYNECVSIAESAVDFIHQYDEDRPIDDGALLGALKLLSYRFPGNIRLVETWALAAIVFVQKYYDKELSICLSLRHDLSRAAFNYPESSLLKDVLFKARGGEALRPNLTRVEELDRLLEKSERFKPGGLGSLQLDDFDRKLRKIVSKSSNNYLRFSTTYLFSGDNPKGMSESLSARIRGEYDKFDVNENLSSLYKEFSDIIDSLVDAIKSMERREKIEEGLLPFVDEEKHLKNLYAYLGSENVPESERPGLVQKLKIEIARVTRPKWIGRLERGGELATLSAPLFLKRVHTDYIGKDGTVENETIRAIDPELMRAVEFYISKRRNRGVDLGDAEGLQFVLSRPSKGDLTRSVRAIKEPI